MLCQKSMAKIKRRQNSQVTLGRLMLRFNKRMRLCQGIFELQTMVVKLLAEFRDAYFTCAPGQELLTEFGFKQLDLFTHRRRRQKQFICRTCKTLVFDNR